MGEKVLSISKRDAYMRYIDLPKSTDVRFELATIIKSDDKSGDKDLLLSKGWNIVDSWEVAKSPTEYRQYVSNSYAEISCPKPIFRELKTGWISDRSVCYLACGRPVLAENTGFSDYLPTGKGLLVFSNLEEAVARVKEIENNYAYHANAARELAENIFNSDQCLTKMLNL